jgi:Fe(3+) dicitrate transport protein
LILRTPACSHGVGCCAFILSVLASAEARAQAEESPQEPPPTEATQAAGSSEPAEIEADASSSEPSSDAAAEAESDAETEITVVGVRAARAPGSAHVIGKTTLERTEYDDPHAILQTVPGVYVRTEDGMGLRPNIGLRGAASDRSKKVTLMEDGVLLGPAPYSAPAAYYFPLVTRFTQVRVIKGPSAIQHGPQTTGGAIDFITRPIPAMESGEIDIAGGQFAYAKAHAWAGTSTDRMAFLIEGAHVRTDGFKELPGGEDTGYYRNEVVFKGTFTPDPRSSSPSELGLKLSYSDELSNESYLGLTDEDFRENPLQRYGPSKLDHMKWHRTGVSVSHRVELLRDLKILTTVYRNDLSRSWRKVNHFGDAALFDVLTRPDGASNRIFVDILRGETSSSSGDDVLFIGPNNRDYVSQGIQTRISWLTRSGPLAHGIEYGLRLHYDRIERHHTEDAFEVVDGDLIATDTPTDTTALGEAWTEAGAFHAVDAISWNDLTVTPGIRIEVMRSAAIDHFLGTETRGATQVALPGGGVVYALMDELNVLAGVYRGFSPPPPGSPETTGPEQSLNYEAGARYTRERLRAEIIGYYNDYSNLTDICTISNSCVDPNTLDRQFDAGKARIYGLEGHASHEIPIGSLTLPVSASYTLALSEFLNTFRTEDPILADVEAGDEIPYVPRHQANALVGVDHERAGGYVTGTFVSAMREQAGSEPLDEVLSTDDQLTFDVGGYFRPLAWLKVYANVRNVLDSHYLVSRRPFGARPNAPRWIQVGAKASF